MFRRAGQRECVWDDRRVWRYSPGLGRATRAGKIGAELALWLLLVGARAAADEPPNTPVAEAPATEALGPATEPASPPLPPASAPPLETVAPGTTARVAMRVDYSGAALEFRRFGTFDEWRSGCLAPCNRRLFVDGMEARVVAPGMTPSKPFRIEPGSGSALLSIDGGSANAHRFGRIALFSGVPLSFAGMTMLGYGVFDDRPALETSGAIVLGLGAALVLTALPLLVSGSTEVTNADGDLIGSAGSRSLD